MKLFKFCGVSVELSTFFIFFFALIVGLIVRSSGWEVAMHFAYIILTLYVFVLMHEFGHVFAAKHYGYGCEKIVMHPFGGLAHLRWSLFEYKSNEEFWIAISGPLVNLFLALVLLPLTLITEEVWRFIELNLIMCAFNLLPLPIMDGGRILRSFLRPHCKNLYTATKYSTMIGCAFIVPLVVYFTFFQINVWVIFLIGVILLLGFQELKISKYVSEYEHVYRLVTRVKRLESLLGR
jgi:Zn-dependent protease